MSQLLLNTLNNLEYSDHFLKQLKRYLRTGNVPQVNTDRGQKKFEERYQDDYVIEGDHIVYEPLNLELVSGKDRDEKLKKMYDDLKIGTGAGIKSFYSKVMNKYLGISREDIRKFLEKQSPYQLTKQEPKIVNKPIITRYPNERWQADLIDVEAYAKDNQNHKYILTIIDNFSKYVFAKGLVKRDAVSILEAFEDIIENQALHTYPKIIQTDNGGEFKNKTFQDWAKLNDIKLKLSLSHTPTSNALIENFNNILRKMIREGFIRTNSLNWIDHLDDYLYNRNNTKHTTTKYTPDELWRRGRNPIDNNDYNYDELHKASDNIQNKARKKLALNKAVKYKDGDKVRVLMKSLYAKIRKLYKSGDKKYVVAKYTPDIYTIVTTPAVKGLDAEFVKPRYKLIDPNGNYVLTELKRNNPNAKRGHKLFFASELQKVDEENIPTKGIKQEDAIELNQPMIDFNNVMEKQKVKTISTTPDDPLTKVHQTRSRTKQQESPPTKIHQTRSRGLTK